jgi:hypothetical protein
MTAILMTHTKFSRLLLYDVCTAKVLTSCREHTFQESDVFIKVMHLCDMLDCHVNTALTFVITATHHKHTYIHVSRRIVVV